MTGTRPRVLITGGCGFIGTNLLEHFAGLDAHDVTVLDNESLGTRDAIAEFDVEFVHGDIGDYEVVRQALEGVEQVVHLAADTRVMDSIEDPRHNFEVNVIGTFNLLCAAREAGVQRVVNASTGGAILGDVEPPVHERMAPSPASPYGASKLAVEGYCSAFADSYGLASASLRFSNVYGPRSIQKGSVVAHFFRQIIAGEELVVYGDGTQTRDYVFSQDLARIIADALDGDAVGAFQLGTGIATDLNTLIDVMGDVVGSDFPIKVRYEPFRAGEVRNSYCDISKARAELGYDPSTSLADGLAKTWSWFRAQ